MPNRLYKFVHLHLTSNISLFKFTCLTSNFCRQKRTTAYGRKSLVSDFKPTRKNVDLLSSRQINFWGTAPCPRVYLNAHFRQNVSTSWRGSYFFKYLEWSASRHLGLLAEYKWNNGVRNNGVFDKLLRLRHYS